ncbi:hypothetical protein ACWEKM_07165 [Streptomyces sp. NPDC004752]
MLNSSNASCRHDAVDPTPASSNAKSPAGLSKAQPTALQTTHSPQFITIINATTPKRVKRTKAHYYRY